MSSPPGCGSERTKATFIALAGCKVSALSPSILLESLANDVMTRSRGLRQMSQDFIGMSNRRQTPGFLLGASPDGDSERPLILREAERLLAQFSRNPMPVPGTQDRSVTHGHTLFQDGHLSSTWRTPRSESTVVVEAPPSPKVRPPPRPLSTSSDNRSPPSPIARTSAAQGQQSRQEHIRNGSALPQTEKPSVQKVQTLDRSTSLSRQLASKETPRTRRPKTPMSSSGYSSASEAVSSQGSNQTPVVRRSNRVRTGPETYNVRKSLGLDQPENYGASSQDKTSNTEASSQAPSSPSKTQSLVSHQTEREASHVAPNMRRLLFDRELGSGQSHHEICATVSPDLTPWRSWIGASNDVNVLAWSPDGTKFAAGATTHSDEYNRQNNLVLGDLLRNTLTELPDHWIPRPHPSTTVDPRLFTTVSAMQWVGQRLYTASYDHTVKIWDTETQPRASCLRTLKHDSHVVVMALSRWMPHFLATGAGDGSFGLWDLRDQGSIRKPLQIQRDPRQKTNVVLDPTTLAWGQTAETKHLLVGGMQERASDSFKVVLHGHLAMWKLEESSVTIQKLSPDSQNIFDIKWHPSLPRFATGSVSSPIMGLPTGSRSVVHVYDSNAADDKCLAHRIRFGCPARDINEVTLCPMNSAYVTASCTDGNTYVWDHRNKDKLLHKLRHDCPLEPLNPNVSRELTDFGVRVAIWGGAIDQFYTGASDGCLKRWDIRRSSEDALVTNVASFNHGLVSGAFSADQSHLVLGDYGGGIHVLSSGSWAHFEDEEFQFEPAQDPPSKLPEGMTAARELVSKNELVVHPVYGPVQGPSYQGPFAKWARGLADDTPPEEVRRSALLEEVQRRQFDGPQLQAREGLAEHERRELEQHLNLVLGRRQIHTAAKRRAKERTRKRKREREQARQRRLRREIKAEDPMQDDKRSRSLSPKTGDSYLTDKQRRKLEKERRKRRKKHQPIITNVEDTIIDLTLEPDHDSKPEWQSTESEQDRQSQCIIKVLEEDVNEDYWWPESGTVDANLPDECFVSTKR